MSVLRVFTENLNGLTDVSDNRESDYRGYTELVLSLDLQMKQIMCHLNYYQVSPGILSLISYHY